MHLHEHFALRDGMEINYVSVATKFFRQDIQVRKECNSTSLEMGNVTLQWTSFEMLHYPLSFFPLAEAQQQGFSPSSDPCVTGIMV